MKYVGTTVNQLGVWDDRNEEVYFLGDNGYIYKLDPRSGTVERMRAQIAMNGYKPWPPLGNSVKISKYRPPD